MEEATNRKKESLQPLKDSLETRHTVSANPISIGSRIPTLNMDSIYDLHLNQEQTLKLQNKIWHNTLTDLHAITKAYHNIQETTTHRTKRPLAIPRKT